jgi:hypothetical protein
MAWVIPSPAVVKETTTTTTSVTSRTPRKTWRKGAFSFHSSPKAARRSCCQQRHEYSEGPEPDHGDHDWRKLLAEDFGKHVLARKDCNCQKNVQIAAGLCGHSQLRNMLPERLGPMRVRPYTSEGGRRYASRWLSLPFARKGSTSRSQIPPDVELLITDAILGLISQPLIDFFIPKLQFSTRLERI